MASDEGWQKFLIDPSWPEVGSKGVVVVNYALLAE
jgi:hypothetical protein